MKRNFIQTLILLFSLLLLSVEAYSAVAPTRQARYIGFSNKTGTSIDVSWFRGNGAKSVLLVKEFTGNTPTDIQFSLANGDNISYTFTTSGSTTITNYSWNSSTYTATFTGSGVTQNNNTARVVYNGTGNSVRIEGFNPGSKYLFKVLEYNEGGTPSTAFNTGTNTANPRNVLFPGNAPSSFTYSATASSASISWPAVANNITDWGYYLTVNDQTNTALTSYDNIDIGVPNDFSTYYLNGSTYWASWEIFDLSPSTTYYAKVQGYSGSETTPVSSSFSFTTSAPPAVTLPAANIVLDKVNSSQVSLNSKTFTEADIANGNMFKVALYFGSAMDITSTPSITFTDANGIGLGSNTVTGGSFTANTNYWSSDSKTFTQLFNIVDNNVNYSNNCVAIVTSAKGEGGSVLNASATATQLFTIDTKAPDAGDFVATNVQVDNGNTDVNVVVKTGYWNASNKELKVTIGPLTDNDGSTAGGTYVVQALVLSAGSSTAWVDIPSASTFTLPAATASSSPTFNVSYAPFASWINSNNSNTIIEVRAKLWDINNNERAATAYNMTDLIIDNNAPVAYTVSGPTVLGGTLVTTGGFSNGGYFNNSNETVRLTIAVPNDASMTSNTISFFSASDARSSTWTSTGWDFANSHTISSSMLNNSVNIDFTKAQLISSFTPALADFETGKLWFKARITEPSGNYREALFTTRTFTVDLTPPAATLTGDVSVTGGVVNGNNIYWNNASTAFSVPYTLQTSDASLTGGTAELLLVNLTSGQGLNDWYSFATTTIAAPAATNTFDVTRAQFISGYPYYPPTTNVSRTITSFVKVTDIAGNSRTYTESSKTITVDESAPNADAVAITTLGVNNSVPAAYNANITYWNTSSTLGTVTMNLPGDASLIGGTVQLKAKKAGQSSFTNIGTAQTITGLSGATATFNVTEFGTWWGGGFATANPSATTGTGSTTVTFVVGLVDAAGNQSAANTGTGSAKTYEVDNLIPATQTIGTIAFGRNGTAYTNWTKDLHDNGGLTATSSTVTVSVPLGSNDASLDLGTIEVLGKESADAVFSYSSSSITQATIDFDANGGSRPTQTIKFYKDHFAGLSFYTSAVNTQKTANFNAKVTDRAGNSNTFTASNSMLIDYTAPAVTTTGNVDIVKTTAPTSTLTSQSATFTKFGGHGEIYVYVPLQNDATLVNGSLNIMGYDAAGVVSGTYTLLSSNQTITSAMLNTSTPIRVTESQLSTALPTTLYTTGKTLNFNAYVTDNAGNSTTITPNSRQMYLNLSYPSGTATNAMFISGTNQLNGTPVVSTNSASYSWNTNSTSFTIYATAQGITAGTRTMRLEGKKEDTSSWTTLATWNNVANNESNTYSKNPSDFQLLSVYEDNKYIDFRFALYDGSTGTETYSPERRIFVKRTALNPAAVSVTARYWNAANDATPSNITGLSISDNSNNLYITGNKGTITNLYYITPSATDAVMVGSTDINAATTNITVDGSNFQSKSFANNTVVKFSAAVKDYAGNSTTYTTSTNGVTVDKTNPTVASFTNTIVGGNAGAVSGNSKTWNATNDWMTFANTVSDAHSGIGSVNVYRRTGATTTVVNNLGTATSGSTTITKNTFEGYGASPTATTFWITVSDNAGNATSSTTFTITNYSRTFNLVQTFNTGAVNPSSATYTSYSGGYYYNSNHTKINSQITVPISADVPEPLVGGFIKYQAKQTAPSTGDWVYINTINPSTALVNADLNTSKTFEFTNIHGQLTEGATYIFRAVVTDIYGNAAYANQSTNSIAFDRTLPTPVAMNCSGASQDMFQPVVTNNVGTVNSPSNFMKATTDILKVYLPVHADASFNGGYYDIYNNNNQLIKRYNITSSTNSASYTVETNQNAVPYSTKSTAPTRTDVTFKINVSDIPEAARTQDASYWYYAKITDVAGNERTYGTCGGFTDIKVDLLTPASPTINTVAANGAGSVAGYWNKANVANNGNVRLNVQIPNFVSLSSGTVTIEGKPADFAGSWSVLKKFTIAGVNQAFNYDIPSSTITGLLSGYNTSATSQTITFRAKVETVTNKVSDYTSSSYASTNSIVNDQTNPFSVVFNTVTPTGGYVKNGFWNNSNTGVAFQVTLPTDATIEGGTVVIKGTRISPLGSPTDVTGTNTSITWSNSTMNIATTEANYEGGAWWGNGSATTFTAYVTDKAGNSASFSYGGSLFNHTTVPSALATPAPSYVVTGGTVVSGYYNDGNTGVTLTGQIPLQVTTYGIVDMANSLPGTLHWYAERTSPTSGTLSLGNNTTIQLSDINNPKNAAINFDAFVAANSSSFTEGSLWRFYGIIEDFAGNYSVASATSGNVRYDATAPSSMTTSGVLTGAVTLNGIDNGLWNTTASSLTITTAVTDPMGIYQFGQNGTFWAQFTKDGGNTWVTPETYTPVTVSGSSSTWIVLSGSSLSITAADQALGFRIVAKDYANNTGYGSYNNSHTIRVELTPPTAQTTGLVKVRDGVVVPSNWNNATTFGYWNTSNTFIDVTFPIVDNALVGGRSYIYASRNGGAYSLLTLNNATSSTITQADRNAGTKTLTINNVDFGTFLGVNTDGLIQFYAKVTDINGNETNYSPSSTTVSVDLVAPAGVAFDNGIVTGGNVVANYFNGTNTLLDLPVDYPNDPTLAGGTVMFTRNYTLNGSTTTANIGPFSATFNLSNISNTFTSNTLVNGLMSDGGIIWFNATVTDVAGNSTSFASVSSSYTLDRQAPTLAITTSNPYYTASGTPTITGTISDNLTTDINNTLTLNGNKATGAALVQQNATVAPGGNWGVTVNVGNTLTTGWNSLTFTATDLAGNSSVQTMNVVLDNQNPVITVNSDNNAATTPVITGSVADVTNTTVYVKLQNSGYNNTEVFTSSYTSSTYRTWSHTWGSQLTPGSYTITTWGFDVLNNASSTVTGTLVIPTVVAVTINAGQQFTTSTQVITGTVTAGATVVATVNGVNYNGNVSGTTWSVTTTLADGMNYNVSATATLNATTATANSTVSVDATAPLVGLTTTNMMSNAANPSFGGTVSDATSGVATVNVALTGAGTTNQNATVNAGTWTVTFNGLAQGNYNVTVTATDNLGNTSQTTGTLLVDRTGPVLTFNSPTFSQSQTPTLWGTYSDNFDSAPSLTITLNNGGGTYYGANVTMSSGTWTVTTGTLTRGTTYTVTPSGKDATGNSASSVVTGTVEIQAIYTYFEIAGNGDELVSISSLANTTPVEVWEMAVTDNVNAQNDMLNVNIAGIVINQASGNTAVDWSQYINSAALYVDGTNTLVGTGTVGANNITFSGLNYSVPNGTTGYLDLFITLKTTLPAGADGKLFRFTVSNGNVTVGANSTPAGVFTATSTNNMNVIDVAGTTFAFTQQPVNVPAREVAPAVNVSRVDANGNVDWGYIGNVTVNSSATLFAGTTTKVAVNGVATFDDFNYDAPTQVVNLTVNGTSVTSNNFTVRAARPTTAASSLNYTARSRYSISLAWTNGNGSSRIGVAREANALTASEQPVDGTLYTGASSSFTVAQSLGNGKVVHNATSSAVTVDGLQRLTTYYFAIYEYNTNTAGDAWSASYLIANAPTLNVTTLRKETGFENSVDGVTVSELGPNPAYNQIAFNLGVEDKSTISVEIRNIAGQLIATPIANVEYGAGSHRVVINLDANTISSGTYLMTITVNGGETIMQRFVVQK